MAVANETKMVAKNFEFVFFIIHWFGKMTHPNNKNKNPKLPQRLWPKTLIGCNSVIYEPI